MYICISVSVVVSNTTNDNLKRKTSMMVMLTMMTTRVTISADTKSTTITTGSLCQPEKSH